MTEEPKYIDNEKKLKIEVGNNVKQIKNVKQNENTKQFQIKIGEGQNKKEAFIKIEKVGNKFKVIFEVSQEEKKKRIKDILTAIKDGLYAQSSGEANKIVPLFIISAPVKVPSPIFHSYIDIIEDKDAKSYKVKGISDCLKNSWLGKMK